MGERSSPTSPPQEFLTDLQGLLAAAYAECFTEETKRVRNAVLVTGFVLLLFALGVLSVGHQPVNVPILGLPVTVTKGLRWVLIVLCAYFLFLLGARSFTEWHLWRLKQQAPMLALHTLSGEIASATADIMQRQATALQQAMDLHEKIVRMPRGTAAADAEYEGLVSEHRALLDEAASDRARRELEQLRARQETILALLQPARRTFAIRFWIEALFPMAFGAFAILAGALAP